MNKNTLTLTLLTTSLAALYGCNRTAPEDKPTASNQPSVTIETKKTDIKTAKADIPAPDDVKAAPSNAKKTASGLASLVLTKGKGGDKPQLWDKVKVHYSGWTTDGKMFDSSIKRDRPATFGLKNVIPGWTEGLQLMEAGEKRRFWIPKELAYDGKPGRPQGMLVFDVELLEIIPGKAPLPAPKDVAAAPADAKKTASGLAYTLLTKGSGKITPRAFDRVKVHYTGWMTNGEMFDSSVQRERPATFALNKVIKGWTEGVQLMKQGDKFRFWIPATLAYGEKASRPGAPHGELVFDIELLEINKMPEPPKVPKDVAAAPSNAKSTSSGLKYRVLKAGKGKRPVASDKVEVHYSGWTTDGKMFDSSVSRGKPATFPLGGVIKGWTEGLQLMKVGEKTRFWIPGDLAYGEKPKRPGAPSGTLVFDVELLKIIDS